MRNDILTQDIIGCAIEVHRQLGPGLLESAYQRCLAFELDDKGIPFETEVVLPVNYKGHEIDCAYRLDFLIADSIILELKSVNALAPIHTAQLLTYLKISNLHLGYLINFNVTLLKNGINRVVNGYL